MKTEATDIPRRTWAPFVGAALAALTAGSLVVFSLIAQRTSLDGFPDRRITPAESAGDGTPSSITIAPVDGEGSAGGPRVAREAAAESAPSATALLEVAESTPPPSSVAATDTSVAATDTSVAATDTSVAATDTNVAISDEAPALARGGAPSGAFRAEQPLLTRRGGGGSYEQDEMYAAGWDLRHDGRHTHKSHDLKDGRKKARTKAKAARKRSKGDFKAKAAGRKGIPGHAARNRGGHGAASNSNPPRPAKPARSSSRPTPASREATGRSNRSAGSPPAHSNAGGNRKSRGRGHGKH